ncbi:MAG: carbon-nitrogen hydrolase family protein [Candidatus Heimdallarchaeota archaeon]
MVRVGAIQMKMAGESVKARGTNLSTAVRLMEQAAGQDAEIICLPELFVGAATVEPIPGPTTAILQDFARDHVVYVIGNLYEVKEGKKYSSVPLIDPSGAIQTIYRKIQLFPWEPRFSKCLEGNALGVANTKYGTLGLTICHDLMLPEIPRLLAIHGAEIIFAPGRMPGPFLTPWRDFVRVRAIENNCFVVSVGSAEQHAVGTLIVSPKLKNDVLAEAGPEEQVLVADLDLEWLRASRTDSPLYHVKTLREIKDVLSDLDSHSFLQDRRVDLYRLELLK